MKFSELEDKVVTWAMDRGIHEWSSPSAQLLKTMSELGELADATIKDDRDAIVDGIGDVLVTLVIYADMQGIPSLKHCLREAYKAIKDRTGSMSPGGAFVKDD